MADEAKPPQGEVSWNLSQVLILQIGELLKESTAQFIHGNIAEAFTRLQSIRLLITQDLTPAELEKFKEFEREHSGKMRGHSFAQVGFQLDKVKLTLYADGRNKFMQYQEMLMIALKAHGYSIPLKSDSTRMF